MLALVRPALACITEVMDSSELQALHAHITEIILPECWKAVACVSFSPYRLPRNLDESALYVSPLLKATLHRSFHSHSYVLFPRL